MLEIGSEIILCISFNSHVVDVCLKLVDIINAVGKYVRYLIGRGYSVLIKRCGIAVKRTVDGRNKRIGILAVGELSKELLARKRGNIIIVNLRVLRDSVVYRLFEKSQIVKIDIALELNKPCVVSVKIHTESIRSVSLKLRRLGVQVVVFGKTLCIQRIHLVNILCIIARGNSGLEPVDFCFLL